VPKHGQRVSNLLSRGIVRLDGSPGPPPPTRRSCPHRRPAASRSHPRRARSRTGASRTSTDCPIPSFKSPGPPCPTTATPATWCTASSTSRGGKVVHSYADHASILKFIERNWGLQPLTSRSRDNLPNPVSAAGNPTCRSTCPRSATCSTCSTSVGIT